MKIAFTAPMKPLDDPIPSGDRTMGRLIVRALEEAGHEVRVATRFRAWRATGGEEAQTTLRAEALNEAEQVAKTWAVEGYQPDLFLTYHLYHKAPDWIGPALADRFCIPYAIVEASRAPKRQAGDWAIGFAAADTALKRADAVAALHRADAECLAAVVDADHLSILLPFLDAEPFAEAGSRHTHEPNETPRLLCVGMMREGDKTHSYEVLAAALNEVSDLDWQLTVVGDGPSRDHVLALFPPARINWRGALAPEDLPACYAAHDLFVWPAIREAFGFVFLEAQASGLGVIAGDTFGVPDIVRNGETGLLSPEGDVTAFAANLRKALTSSQLRISLGQAARAHIKARHTLTAGANRLQGLLDTAMRNHTHRASKAGQ